MKCGRCHKYLINIIIMLYPLETQHSPSLIKTHSVAAFGLVSTADKAAILKTRYLSGAVVFLKT